MPVRVLGALLCSCCALHAQGSATGTAVKSPKEVLEQYCAMDEDGKRLEALPEILALLAKPAPSIQDGFEVIHFWETGWVSITQTRAEAHVHYCIAAHVDSRLRVSEEGESLSIFERLFLTLDPGSGHWLVEAPQWSYVSFGAAIRYLAIQAAKNGDTEVRRNAVQTLAFLRKHRKDRYPNPGRCCC